MAGDLIAAEFEPRLPLAVAYSGGADSTALLCAAARRWPGEVIALHVNHGLQAAATEFEAHCIAACVALGIPLMVARVDAAHAPGQSPEDAARRARWRAILQMAEWAAQTAPQAASNSVFERNGITVQMFIASDAIKNAVIAWAFQDVALAQHADDQAETLLLALSRGAGLGGLSGMPAVADRDGLRLHRPLLGVRRSEIIEWLQAQGIGWIEDPSNASSAYTRNRIRNQALPALEAALPGFAGLASRSAQHIAQAQSLLEELAEIDLGATGIPPAIRALQALSPSRQANALRHWLAKHHQTQASTAQLAELQKQITACQTRGHQIALKVGAGAVVKAGDVIAFESP